MDINESQDSYKYGLQMIGKKWTAKACGKILIAGGYGVLQNKNVGLSLAIDSYFYCTCIYHGNEGFKYDALTQIYVQSPQIHQQWIFIYKQTFFEVQGKKNKFVQSALKFTLKHFGILQKAGKFTLKILFDKQFLSLGSELTANRFCSYQAEYEKTGLGSSACVLVSIVGSICGVLGQANNKHLINCISQVANLSAQNKIGSNFDISTAIYGTQLYQNNLAHAAFQCLFSQSIDTILSKDSKPNHLTHPDIMENKTCAYIIDLQKGASTCKMVKSFLQRLKTLDLKLQTDFFSQSKKIAINLFKNMNKQVEIDQYKLLNQQHRALQQYYGKLTQVQIEPLKLKNLIDQICILEGTIYAICPGSGGYDAIFILALKAKELQQIKAMKLLLRNHKFKLRKIRIKWSNQMKLTQIEMKQIDNYQ